MFRASGQQILPAVDLPQLVPLNLLYRGLVEKLLDRELLFAGELLPSLGRLSAFDLRVARKVVTVSGPRCLLGFAVHHLNTITINYQAFITPAWLIRPPTSSLSTASFGCSFI